jgi:hypothetical protein
MEKDIFWILRAYVCRRREGLVTRFPSKGFYKIVSSHIRILKFQPRTSDSTMDTLHWGHRYVVQMLETEKDRVVNYIKKWRGLIDIYFVRLWKFFRRFEPIRVGVGELALYREKRTVRHASMRIIFMRALWTHTLLKSLWTLVYRRSSNYKTVLKRRQFKDKIILL